MTQPAAPMLDARRTQPLRCQAPGGFACSTLLAVLALLEHDVTGRKAHLQQRPAGVVLPERQPVAGRSDRRRVEKLRLTARVELRVLGLAGVESEVRPGAAQRAHL